MAQASKKLVMAWSMDVVELGFERCLFGCLFDDHLWELSDSERHFDEEQARLLILEAYDSERRRKFSGEPKLERKREPISESVRTHVRRRDGGRCISGKPVNHLLPQVGSEDPACGREILSDRASPRDAQKSEKGAVGSMGPIYGEPFLYSF